MYTATGTKAVDKEQFVAEFTPLVKRIAYHMMTRLPASVQVDDLILRRLFMFGGSFPVH